MDFKNLNNLNKRKLEEEVEIDAEKLKKSEIYKEKGNELFKKSMFDEALDYYFKSITLNPTDHRCYGNIGQILINKSLYSEAKECLQAAIDLNSNYTKAYYRLGLIEKHLKNYDEALRNFDTVLKLEPNNKATIKECDEIKSKLGIGQNDNVKIGNPFKASTIRSNDSSAGQNNTALKSASSTSTTAKKAAIKVEKIAIPKLNIPVRLPTSLPKTAYQFNLTWKEIKDSQTKMDYLKFVGADHFFKLFQKNLEPDFLSELIVLFTKMGPNLVCALLNSISKIDKFDFLVMFLSNSEKASLRQTINSLQAADSELLIRLYKV